MALEEIREGRISKAQKVKDTGEIVYPAISRRSFSLSEIIKSFSKISDSKKEIVLAGRVFAIRSHGGVIFADFKDGSLSEEEKPVSLQAYIKKENLGEEKFSLFEDTVDTGDFVEFTGTLTVTKRNENSIEVSDWRFLAKSLRPLPEKWHGLSDIEERFRKRYLDLVMGDEVYSRFVLRSKIVTEIRNFLNSKGYLEMETSMLHSVAGGALAQPFKTHHNALDIDLYLRIAPELYLKRLLIGGIEKVYELGRNFRNEGVDITHNPEFTMLEFYAAYQDSLFMREEVEKMLKYLIKKVFKKESIVYEGNEIFFDKKFQVISFNEILKRYALIADLRDIPLEELKLKAQQLGVNVEGTDSKGKISDNIFKKICRPKIIQPTFIIDHPLDISPLAKQKEGAPDLADRFQLIIGGLELVNGFSELNDPLEQRERFLKQQELRKAGDAEAPEFDEQFVEAMEYGMPPAGGVGIGIDRLVMFFCDIRNIKEAILFPTMRPK